MSSLEISLLGGLPNLGGLLSMPLCGWAFNTIGRKYGTILFVLPFIVSFYRFVYIGWVKKIFTLFVKVLQ